MHLSCVTAYSMEEPEGEGARREPVSQIEKGACHGILERAQKRATREGATHVRVNWPCSLNEFFGVNAGVTTQ